MIGRAEALAPDVRTELLDAERKTAKNTGMLFNIALNYGGRTEIVDAARRAIESGITPEDARRAIASASLLYTGGQPDPDLLIRTSGEMRVSNFLLWQIAYAEIWVTDTLWPDFRCRHLLEGVLAYQKRDRRFGGITPPVSPPACSEPSSTTAMTRVLSGVVLGAVALRADLVPQLHRAARRRARRRARWPSTNTTASSTRSARRCRTGRRCWRRCWSCAMVPFQWVDIESVLAGALLLIALNVLASDARRRAAARGYRGGGAGAGLHRPAARLPGRRARDRRHGKRCCC